MTWFKLDLVNGSTCFVKIDEVSSIGPEDGSVDDLHGTDSRRRTVSMRDGTKYLVKLESVNQILDVLAEQYGGNLRCNVDVVRDGNRVTWCGRAIGHGGPHQ